ncbi:MAG: glycosyltransferase family 2 protein [Burkholderiales bacterium]|nr:glycosyltransferase family 2 protein [Burkholderiales bacterium]
MIHVAIISHGHEQLLISSYLGGLQGENEDLHVWIKDNQPSRALKEYCHKHGVSYTDASPGMGFGENNNFLFESINNSVGFKKDDYFVVMNPDISTTPETIRQLVRQMREDHFPLATLNLYRDAEHHLIDANIRHFPNLYSLVRMLALRSLSRPYDKASLQTARHVDWASGAFLAFEAQHFQSLQGFDSRYFMYFEDVDICYRSRQLLGKGVRYYPQLTAMHAAAHKNRNLVSRHANWFFRSFLKFLSRRYFVYDRRRNQPVSK